MKPEIHPQVHPVVFVDSSSKDEFIATSTMTSEETREINGVEHFVIYMEVTSASHPFYTGKQRFVDSAGQVDKFRKTVEMSAQVQKERGTKSKKEKRKERSKGTKKAARAALKDALAG